MVVGALVVSIVLAMGGSSRPRSDEGPTAPPATADPESAATPFHPTTSVLTGEVPRVVPVIVPPEVPLRTTRKATLVVDIPDPDEPLQGLTLTVYRNGEVVMDAVRVRGLSMSVKGIPLKRGQNRITVALANAAGAGQPSEPVVIVVDDRPPKLEVKEPTDGSTVNSALATVRGVTEPGLTVTVRNPGFGATEEAVADERGVFITEIRLDKATNRLEVQTSDAAGNESRRSVSVVRGDTDPQARLTLSKPRLLQADLPQSITIRFDLDDPDGRPIDGATVTFTLTLPGLDTVTYTTQTADGVARWEGVLIQGASKGNGWVTARAELAGGLAPALATGSLSIK